MSPSNIPIFLQIVGSARTRIPTQMLVSCPNADGVYGGAMGPAQFEPSTWELYVSQIASITGDNPPSPWSNADAFVATALYLKGAMQGCQAVYSAQLDIDRCTAAKYYAGGDLEELSLDVRRSDGGTGADLRPGHRRRSRARSGRGTIAVGILDIFNIGLL